MHQLTDEELYQTGKLILDEVTRDRPAYREMLRKGHTDQARAYLDRQKTLLSALRKIVAAVEIPAAPAEAS